ncbi:MAG TPA: NnrU family protein [Rhodanobacteraceae bacterium]|nr:NnrU family protein [Rhodanobacteraceae bacterium]
MRNTLVLLYGFIAYIVFLLTFLYAIGFVGDFLVPRTIDRPPQDAAAMPLAWIVDVALLGLFAVQHSAMARRGFKDWLTRWLPAPIERSTYVLVTSLVLILLFWQWRPLPGVIWDVGAGGAWWMLLYALFALGWLLVLAGTFVINHFDLFGLRQVWFAARSHEYPAVEFKEGWFYRLVRHPLMLGFIVAFWATPRMSTGHLLFAVATTGYILIAVRFLEERDLVAMHGETYRDYQRRVPMLCPWPRPRHTPTRPMAQVE